MWPGAARRHMDNMCHFTRRIATFQSQVDLRLHHYIRISNFPWGRFARAEKTRILPQRRASLFRAGKTTSRVNEFPGARIRRHREMKPTQGRCTGPALSLASHWKVSVWYFKQKPRDFIYISSCIDQLAHRYIGKVSILRGKTKLFKMKSK